MSLYNREPETQIQNPPTNLNPSASTCSTPYTAWYPLLSFPPLHLSETRSKKPQNNIRKALRPESYASTNRTRNHSLHQDHCIEQLRQYIMCSGDMTPIPTKYYAALGRNYVASDVRHTCRDFERLREWVVERYEGETAVQPRERW